MSNPRDDTMNDGQDKTPYAAKRERAQKLAEELSKLSNDLERSGEQEASDFRNAMLNIVSEFAPRVVAQMRDLMSSIDEIDENLQVNKERAPLPLIRTFIVVLVAGLVIGFCVGVGFFKIVYFDPAEASLQEVGENLETTKAGLQEVHDEIEKMKRLTAEASLAIEGLEGKLELQTERAEHYKELAAFYSDLSQTTKDDPAKKASGSGGTADPASGNSSK